MMTLTELIDQHVFSNSIKDLDFNSKMSLNTINAHSYCVSRKDIVFQNALLNSDFLLADGVSIVLAAKFLLNKKIIKIAGADLHLHLLDFGNRFNKRIFYLGSSQETLRKIHLKVNKNYPNIELKSFSPPFKQEFNNLENENMISRINLFKPDILFIGMTAPKQEKWLEQNKHKLDAQVTASIGAVFDFYAGNIDRAPDWMIDLGMEWFFRLYKEPRRMWRRYLVNNFIFILIMFKEYFFQLKH